MKKGAAFLIIFGLFWTTFVLVVDVLAGSALLHQIRSPSFASTTGVITHSEVTTHIDSDSTTFGVDIRYHYEVDGRPFEGDRYRYGAGSSSDSTWARDAVARYSVGSEPQVFYDPKNPAESLLSTGLDGSNLMWLVFLTPFNMVMLAFVFGAGYFVRKKLFKSVNGGVKLIEDGPLIRIPLPRFPAWAMGIAITGGIAFVEMFLLAFTGGFHPKTGMASAALFIAYGSGIFVVLRQWQKTRSGHVDLTIDKSAETVELPATFGRKQRMKFALSEIFELTVESVPHTGSKGGTTYSYTATLLITGQELTDGKLGEWTDETEAENFVTWLRPQLKIANANKKSTAWNGTMPVPERAKDIS